MLVTAYSAAMLVAPQAMAEEGNQPVKAGCATLTDTEKDGSSTGGIIAGVVLGLLALIGIVVATNPGILNMF